MHREQTMWYIDGGFSTEANEMQDKASQEALSIVVLPYTWVTLSSKLHGLMLYYIFLGN